MKSRSLLVGGAFCCLLANPSPGAAQIGGMLRGAVNNQIQRKIDDAVACAFGDQACINKAHADGKKVTVVDKNGKPLKDQSSANVTTDSTAAPGAAGAGDPPGKGVWLNYDFIPGERVLFCDDFADDHVGDLPTHEDVSSGNLTVVDIKGHKYLHTVTGADLVIVLPEVLPQRFTIEFVMHRRGGNGSGLYVHMGPDGADLRFRCDQGSATLYGHGANGPKESGQEA
jgi:hypothetical protein